MAKAAKRNSPKPKPKKTTKGTKAVKSRSKKALGGVVQRTGESRREEQNDARESYLRSRTRAIAEQCAEDGVTPLEVMLMNMRWAHDESVEVLSRFFDFMEFTKDTIDLSDKEKVKEARAEAEMLKRTFLRFRELSQKFAVDAAPYVHPRLAAIEFKPKDKESIREIRRTIVDGNMETRLLELEREGA